jgi:hypothetical protein
MWTLLAIPLLVVCCFGPGFFILRRFRLTADERLCASLAVSQGLIYVISTAIYLCRINWHWCWAIVAIFLTLTLLAWRDLAHFLARRHVQRRLCVFALLLLIGLLMISLIRHQSGGAWSNDWLEHYQRAIYFLNRQPPDTTFTGNYILPARPPMMNLVAAFFMAITQPSYPAFQVICLFLNAIVFFPCMLIAGWIFRGAGRHAGLIGALLLTSPVFVQNITWTWTKLNCAFFILFAIALYIRGWRSGSSGRIIASFATMAMATLVHYSAGPYLLFLGIHYLLIIRTRRRPLREIVLSITASCAILMTWFAWAIFVFGPAKTFGANTTVAGAQGRSIATIAGRSLLNLYWTVVPCPLRMSLTTFDAAFVQPNLFGYIRDQSFVFFQQNLPATLGIVGGVCAVWLLVGLVRRTHNRAMLRFWLALLVFTILTGVAVVGSGDSFGLAHICLQPITMIGLSFVAAAMPRLTPAWRVALLLSISIGVVLGILLQLRVEMLAIRPEHVGEIDAIPLCDGLPSATAVCNAIIRSANSVDFLSDRFTGSSSALFALVAIAVGVVLWALGRMMLWDFQGSRRNATLATMLVIYVGGAIACGADGKLGYSIPPALADLPAPSLEQIVRRVREEPESASARYDLAAAYYRLGRSDEALNASMDALLLDPRNPKTRYLFALWMIVYHVPVDDVTNTIYSGTWANTPRTAAAYGENLYRSGFTNRAIEVLNEGIRRHPHDSQLHIDRAVVLFRAGRASEAIADAEDGVRAAPDSAKAVETLETILRSRGESAESIQRRMRELRGR